jgi:hypothetical protein
VTEWIAIKKTSPTNLSLFPSSLLLLIQYRLARVLSSDLPLSDVALSVFLCPPIDR